MQKDVSTTILAKLFYQYSQRFRLVITVVRANISVSSLKTTMKTSFLIAAFFALVFKADGFKVLGILPFGSNSHFAIGNSILKNLHKAGHEVTVISPYPQKKQLEKYRDISTADMLEKQRKGDKEKN
jgi:hypothetical protein